MSSAETAREREAPEDGAGGAPGSMRRLPSADLEVALERFDDPKLLEEGKVNIIALDAIVERLGARWPLRKEQVYDHVDRTLQRHLGMQGYYLRISETDILIAQPDLGKFAGQAACLRYLRDLLTHFLGEGQMAEYGVHTVHKVTPHGVEAEKVDVRGLDAAEQKERAAIMAAPAGTTSVQRWSPFVAADGRTIRVSSTLEPVFELKSFGRIGFRMARRVLLVATEGELSAAEQSNLSRADILKIDMATIMRGLDRLRTEEGEKSPSLIIPVSYTSLSSQRGRAEIVDAFKQAAELVDKGVICEICEIEGVPHGALLSAVSLIRPFSLFVVGRLHVTPPTAPAQLRGSGLQALSFECPPNLGEAEFLGWLKSTIEACKQVAKPVLVYRTASARYAGIAGLMGATHASVRKPN